MYILCVCEFISQHYMLWTKCKHQNTFEIVCVTLIGSMLCGTLVTYSTLFLSIETGAEASSVAGMT